MTASEQKFIEIFSLSQDPDQAEVGGGHGQKGVDFQRFWAMIRIFELKQSGATDFLILFESVQDIAELDSETAPSKIDIYQVKKKDSGEWSFNSLTGIPKPDGRKKNAPVNVESIEKSPLGKLYKAGLSFKHIESAVHFISNAGCDVPLVTSGTASKQLICVTDELDAKHTKALKENLAFLHTNVGTVPDLSKISLRKTTLHPDDPIKMALGTAVEFLTSHMPEHAGQAKSLVDALFMQLSALGRCTQPVSSFAELRQQRGFSMTEMDCALNALKAVPDLKIQIDIILEGLTQEGLGVIRKLGLSIGISKYFSNLVSGTFTAEEQALISACSPIINDVMSASKMLLVLDEKVKELAHAHPTINENEIFAYLLVQVTKHAAAKF